ncbi:MAG: DUF305 domain-containing protein [Planctomycetales bacterium]|nr:DUF305 domain-containing protein [Planctomycetales bacterium]MBN8624921.1 DUF305 domain-containing protein [Planctomycetota bacterium]
MKYLLTSVLSVALFSVGMSQTPPPTTPHAAHDMTEMPKQMVKMNEMIPGYLGAKDANFDKRFIDMMIPHHEGAIIAAKQVLASSERPELKQMAEKMIQAQEAEVQQLKQWRAAWYGN